MILVHQCSEQGCQMHLDSVRALLCTFHGISWHQNSLTAIECCARCRPVGHCALCKASSPTSGGLWDRRQLVLKHVRAKPYLRPPPNNTTSQYYILVTRGWTKRPQDLGFRVLYSVYIVFMVLGCEGFGVSGFSCCFGKLSTAREGIWAQRICGIDGGQRIHRLGFAVKTPVHRDFQHCHRTVLPWIAQHSPCV